MAKNSIFTFILQKSSKGYHDFAPACFFHLRVREHCLFHSFIAGRIWFVQRSGGGKSVNFYE